MSDKQMNSASKTQVPHKGATHRQGRRRIMRLLWILIALAIAIGLAFLPRNQDSPAMEIKRDNSPGEMYLRELGTDLSQGFPQYATQGNEIIIIAATFSFPKQTLIHV